MSWITSSWDAYLVSVPCGWRKASVILWVWGQWTQVTNWKWDGRSHCEKKFSETTTWASIPTYAICGDRGRHGRCSLQVKHDGGLIRIADPDLITGTSVVQSHEVSWAWGGVSWGIFYKTPMVRVLQCVCRSADLPPVDLPIVWDCVLKQYVLVDGISAYSTVRIFRFMYFQILNLEILLTDR